MKNQVLGLAVAVIMGTSPAADSESSRGSGCVNQSSASWVLQSAYPFLIN